MALLYDTTAKILRALLVLSASCLLLNFAAAAEQNIKSIKKPVPAVGKVQQPGASFGGAKAETDSKARRRIPATLRHRERAVSKKDYKKLGNKAPVPTVHRARARPAVIVKTPRKLSMARPAIAQYKDCTALTTLNRRINAALNKANTNNRLIASLRRNKKNSRLANTIRKNVASLRTEIRAIKSMVARMKLPASCWPLNRKTTTHRPGSAETAADQAIDQTKENLERAKEQFKLALRIMTETMERQSQVVQSITRG